MKLPAIVASGRHELENAPAGVSFDGRTRELDVGDLPGSGRYPCRLVGRADGVEVTLPITIAATGEPPAAKPAAPKRRRKPAAK